MLTRTEQELELFLHYKSDLLKSRATYDMMPAPNSPRHGSTAKDGSWNGSRTTKRPDPKHRHVSPLWGLHPGNEITIRGNFDLSWKDGKLTGLTLRSLSGLPATLSYAEKTLRFPQEKAKSSSVAS